MKILFIIPSLKGGGQERAGMLLCNYLMKFHEVTAVCFEQEQEDEFVYRCNIIRIPVTTSKSIVQKARAGVNRIKRLKNLKKQLSPAVSIAFGNTAIILNAMSAHGEKQIASIRQSFSVIRRDKSITAQLHMRMYLWALRRAEYIVPVSNAINNELKDFYNIRNSRFINNGLNHEEAVELIPERKTPVNTDRTWIVHSGRFDRSKGHWHLVRIYAAVRKVVPGVGLILLGTEDNSSMGTLSISQHCKDYLDAENISWAGDFQSETDVVFAGHVSDVMVIMRNCSVFVFPSLWEGFPNAVLEAMSCGLPVVAADCATGPAELLSNGTESFGILLPAFTDDFPAMKASEPLEALWSEAVISLLSDENKLRHYANQSAKRAKDFSAETIGQEWVTLLQDTMAK